MNRSDTTAISCTDGHGAGRPWRLRRGRNSDVRDLARHRLRVVDRPKRPILGITRSTMAPAATVRPPAVPMPGPRHRSMHAERLVLAIPEIGDERRLPSQRAEFRPVADIARRERIRESAQIADALAQRSVADQHQMRTQIGWGQREGCRPAIARVFAVQPASIDQQRLTVIAGPEPAAQLQVPPRRRESPSSSRPAARPRSGRGPGADLLAGQPAVSPTRRTCRRGSAVELATQHQ